MNSVKDVPQFAIFALIAVIAYLVGAFLFMQKRFWSTQSCKLDK